MGYKKTKDISYVAALKTVGQKIYDIQREGGETWFIFEDADRAEEILKKFLNGDLEGSLKRFDEERNTLLDLVKNAR